MTTNDTAAGWAILKRFWHWALAAAVLAAFFAPKPGQGQDGLLHIAAGSTALGLVLVRIGQRLTADLRPRLRSALAPSPTSRIGRVLGFALLALVPAAAALAVGGLEAGEGSPLLDAHGAAGIALILISMVHATLIPAIASWTSADLVGLTLSRPGPWIEGGARGVAGLLLGAALAAAALGFLWGPFEVAARAAALN